MKSHLAELDLEPVMKLLREGDISGWFGQIDGGPAVQEFERKFAEFQGVKYAFAVSSGSAAIYIALRAAGVGRGMTVAVPAYTHIGSVAPIVLAGARPYFLDVGWDGNVIPDKSLKIDAVLVVHQLGTPARLDGWPEVPIIEDCSHAMGAGVGHGFGAFSVGGGRTKMIGVGEGGMVTTDSIFTAKIIHDIRNHGDRMTDSRYFCFNFRMSELNALLGSLQMDHARAYLDRQLSNADYIAANLPGKLKVWPRKDSISYMVPCLVEDIDRDTFLRMVDLAGFKGGLPRLNISSGYTKLVSDVWFYRQYPRQRLPVSKEVMRRAVWFDWHRYPRTVEEIDPMLAAMRRILE